jgi:hypothetical protein
MASPKTTYRVCLYDGRLNSLSAELIEAASDEEAVTQARVAAAGARGEVWHGSRLVAQLGDKGFVPAAGSDWGLTAAG